jgi:signal transduction histidine kinase
VRRIDLIVAELQRMTRLLNGLLQQSSHAVEPRIALDVGRLVHELATLIRYQLPAQIRLAVQAPRGLRCRLPVDGLRQGLLNLVLNSVQAMQADSGEIQLHVERSDRGVCFRVQDDGPGFSEDILSGAVRPFATSHETGTGLGLAIVRRLARELGGELTMSNRSPRGACVMLTVPCDDRHLAAD